MNRTLLAALAIGITGASLLSACSSGSPSSGSSGSSSSGGSGSSDAPASLTVGFDNPLAYTNNMAVLIAIDQGFFTKRGLTVKTVGFSGGSTATRALVAGSADIQAGVGFDAVQAAASNLGVKIFYTVARDSDFALYGSKAAGVSTPAQLKGKSIAVSAFGSYSDFLARSTAKAAGLPPTSIKRVALGTNAALFGGLARGSVAATWNPSGLAGVIKGTSIIGTTKSLNIPTQYSSLLAKTSWLSSHASVAKRFTAAIADAITWHRAHKQEAIALAVKDLKIPQPVAAASYAAADPIFTSDGKVSEAGLQSMADAVPELGIAKSAPKVTDMYVTTYTGGQ